MDVELLFLMMEDLLHIDCIYRRDLLDVYTDMSSFLMHLTSDGEHLFGAPAALPELHVELTNHIHELGSDNIRVFISGKSSLANCLIEFITNRKAAYVETPRT